MRTAILFAVTALTANLAFANEPIDVAGVWAVQSGNAVVEITDCGDGTPCGRIAWVNSPPGVQVKDDKNPDEALRDRPLVGSPLIWGFKAKGDQWKSGKIYDAEGGKTYKSVLELQDDGTLKVKGCVGPICQSQIWTPVSLSNYSR